MNDFESLKDRFNLLSEMEGDLGPGHKSGRWVMFSCPFPGHRHGDANPSLGATPANGRYHCFTCGRSGDVLTWLRDYRGLSWREIAALADRAGPPPPDSRPAGEPGQGSREPYFTSPEPGGPPSPAWQERAAAFVAECEAALWSPAGERALQWLTAERCLREPMIRFYRLGYHPADRWERRADWGLPDAPKGRGVYLPRGVVIPCRATGAWWYVKIRRPAGVPKYLNVYGGSSALFGADNLRGIEILLLTEGELDCILADGLIGDTVGVATLGSACSHLNLARWSVQLLPASLVLVAYDLDEAGRRGVSGLAGLSARIRPARVPALRPGDKDLTDYVRAGGDLWAWLKYQLV